MTSCRGTKQQMSFTTSISNQLLVLSHLIYLGRILTFGKSHKLEGLVGGFIFLRLHSLLKFQNPSKTVMICVVSQFLLKCTLMHSLSTDVFT